MSKAKVTFKGNPLTLVGEGLEVGNMLPRFKVSGVDLNELTNKEFAGKTLIVCSVPSLDTPVCSIEMKRFNEEAKKLESNAAVLLVSMDLPFAMKRWMSAENVSNIVSGSDYKHRSFGEDFGTYIQELGLLARAVFVADKGGKLVHVQYVGEIADEPDYDAALRAVKES